MKKQTESSHIAVKSSKEDIAETEIFDRLLDIAPFARVVTSDPQRIQGTIAGRIEEFPADDVFMETELKPDSTGSFSVPSHADGCGCIGLSWYEERDLKSLELHWDNPSCVPPADAVQLQCWVGASPWQGQWEQLPAEIEVSPGIWRWRVTAEKPDDTPANQIYRVRWVFAESNQPLVLRKISAFSRSSLKMTKVRLESQYPENGMNVLIAVVNGEFRMPDGDNPHARIWNTAQPLDLTVVYTERRAEFNNDCTVLRFELPVQSISVAVNDILDRGCVYVACAGLFASANPPGKTLMEYRREIAGLQTMLEEVRALPDQIFSRAKFGQINPNQTKGPMLLSLACDNRKFVVDRDGTIIFLFHEEGYQPCWIEDGKDPAFNYLNSNEGNYAFGTNKPYPRLKPEFGAGKGEITRYLDGGWLPKPVTVTRENGIKYSQCTYVAPVDDEPPAGSPGWYRNRAVCVVEFTVENTRAAKSAVSLKLSLAPLDGKTKIVDSLRSVTDGVLAVAGDRVAAFFDTEQAAPLTVSVHAEGVLLSGTLEGGREIRMVVYLPAWKMPPDEYASLREHQCPGERVERYWQELLADAMQIEIPDPFLANVIRASQVHCMLAARSDERGNMVAPWIASMSYGPWDSEGQAVIRGMDMTGCDEFARRGLELFLKRYNEQGFMTYHYTLLGTGEHPWTLAEYHARSADREWLKCFAPQLARTCRWIIAQRTKTKGYDARGNKRPEYGLMPPGVFADRNVYEYRFFNNAQFCHALETVSKALFDIGYPEAAAFMKDACEFREDLLRAYHWTQARCPVVPLRNGEWVPRQPVSLGVFYRADYRGEGGAHHIAANRLMGPDSDEVARMMDDLEDCQFLQGGKGYSAEQVKADVYNLGGFSKVQPYYSRNAELHALRDDVRPFIRSYFNALSSLLDDEALSLWEHPDKGGGWNKTHETGWFLCQTAMMFVTEHEGELRLAPMLAEQWFKDGAKITVRNAPTSFGRVSYTIESSLSTGCIKAMIDPPRRSKPKRLVMRIRHPEGKKMSSVLLNGKPCSDFDAGREYIVLPDSRECLSLVVTYK